MVEETAADRNTEGANKNRMHKRLGEERKVGRERGSGGRAARDGGKVTRVCESDRQAGRKGRL